MLLVFALGFLVYQKVERHERQLTQAAIASPNAEPTEVAETQPIAAAATDAALADAGAASLESAATDPLNAATITEVSPFVESDAAQPGELPAEQPADAAPVFAFSEPAEDMTAAPDLLAAATTEPTADVAAAGPDLPGISDMETTPSLAETSGGAEPAELLAPLESSLEPSAGAPVESPAAEVMLAEAVPDLSESDSGNPFNTPESPSAPEPTLAPEQVENPLTISPVDNSPAAAAEEPAPLFLAAADPEPVMEPTAEPAADTSVEPVAVPDAASSDSAPAAAPLGPQLPEFSFSPDAAEAAAAVAPAESEPMSGSTAAPEQTAAEPQLLALAEPQFSPGGATFTEPAPPSAAFRAVTRPGTGSRTGSVGAAGGSAGADRDGRFSLAAFNTQNGAVAAGVDDGEKHKSVIVQNGENYSKISKRVYGTTRYFSALAVFNQHRIPNPNSMRPGMIVLTPDARLLEERYPQLFIDRQPKVEQAAGFLLLDDGSPAYRVGARETLSEISERFLGRSTRWVEIYELNRSVLADPNTLKPGLVLALPEDATEVQLVP